MTVALVMAQVCFTPAHFPAAVLHTVIAGGSGKYIPCVIWIVYLRGAARPGFKLEVER